MSSTSSNTGEFTYNELMEQYVKATRLIEHLKSQRNRSKRAFDKAMDLVLKYDARIAELEAAQRWIPVSEPPKVSGKYLLLNIYDDVYPCDFIAGTEIWVLPDYDTITHWMPLPKLPEVQE